MGNQNTSGVIEKTADESPDNAPEVSSPPQHLEEENKTLIQENAAEEDSAERLESDNKVFEDHKVSVECGDATVIDTSTNHSNLDEGRSKLSHEEQDQPCNFEDIQENQNVLVEETPEIDSSNDAEKNGDQDLALADTPSVEDALSEARAREEELGRDDDPPQENGFLDSPTEENEPKNECLVVDYEEKKPMMHELGNADTNNTGCVDQHLPSDQEISHILIRCSSDPTDMNKSELEENGDHHLLDDAEPTDQSMLEKAVHWESEPSPAESNMTEKCVVELLSSMEIDVNRLSNETAVAETPPSLLGAQYSGGSESKIGVIDSSPSYVRAQIELRKSPSFDFGISFDTKSEESDQTPLLRQDRTARRSLSSCSNVRFQNSGGQTDFVGKGLQFEAVQVEEKTIRMERSNSESSQALNNKQQQENAIVVTKETRDDEAITTAISSKGNSKRKPRSSLFTTCICCTAAIS